jgi:hypothetical protein
MPGKFPSCLFGIKGNPIKGAGPSDEGSVFFYGSEIGSSGSVF